MSGTTRALSSQRSLESPDVSLHVERQKGQVTAVRPLLFGLCRRTAAYVVVPPSFPTKPGREARHLSFLIRGGGRSQNPTHCS